MNIIKNKKVLKGLGQQIDLLNTLSGGVSMAHVDVAKKKDRMVVKVTAPGISPDSLHVVVDYNRLILFGMLPQKNNKELEQPEFNLPLFSQIVRIPFHVDTEQIRAVYENKQLKVILPYNEDRQRTGKVIEIEQI
jgi:HSP20 family molecular chaperone IbpA